MLIRAANSAANTRLFTTILLSKLKFSRRYTHSGPPRLIFILLLPFHTLQKQSRLFYRSTTAIFWSSHFHTTPANSFLQIPFQSVHNPRTDFSPRYHSEMADARYCVEYAKTGRSSCKKCKLQIEKGVARVGKITANPFSDDGGEMKQWYHLKCIFETFKVCLSQLVSILPRYIKLFLSKPPPTFYMYNEFDFKVTVRLFVDLIT